MFRLLMSHEVAHQHIDVRPRFTLTTPVTKNKFAVSEVLNKNKYRTKYAELLTRDRLLNNNDSFS